MWQSQTGEVSSMPLYEYVCDNCQCRFELLSSFGRADGPAECPQCHQGGARRLISLFAVISRDSDGAVSSVAGSRSCAGCSATTCASCKP
ncbi:MAG TPA: zinc ribbon domain-containing protein [Anaerolineae bacterium]|nr:zinc ribbon domain-containing protein [Anaerolineae bacterium]